MVLPIVTGEKTAILRAKTKRVLMISKDVKKLLNDMEETTVAAEGLGIAAPQVGSDLRVCIARINGRLTPLVNPEITWRSTAMDVAEEGCLSLPKVWIPVPRATEIVVRYQTLRGDTKELKLAGMDARVVQHETDHLDGKLIVDYIEPGKVL